MVHKIAYLDGRRLFHVLKGGIDRLMGRQEYLNAINVFPVPDGDTGTNMAMTLRGIVEEMQAQVSFRVDLMSQTMAMAAIDHARGNSGMILAQFFQGFSEAVNGKKKLDTHQFAEAVSKASKSAKHAIADPVEGTIVTVIQSWSKAVKRNAQKTKDFLSVLSESLHEAQAAVAKTIDQLPALKKAGVVDAAGQGFVDMLEGIADFVSRGNLRRIKSDSAEAPLAAPVPETAHKNIDVRVRYCVEAVLVGEALLREKILEILVAHGESVVIAGAATRMRIHLHTNQPSAVFRELEALGRVSSQKVDDMCAQMRAQDDADETVVVIDSGCDLPQEIIEGLDIQVVPVRVRFGDQEYLDKMTLSTDDFFEKYAVHPEHPQTSQPVAGDFQRMFRFLATHYRNCVVLTLPAGASGTHRSALAQIEDVPFENKAVVDSLSLSVGIGLLAMEVAETVKSGCPFEEIRNMALQARERIKEFIVLGNLEAIYRGGRVGGRMKRILEALRLTPVLSVTSEGKVGMSGVIFGRKNRAKKLVRMISRKFRGKEIKRVGIAHAMNQREADELASEMKARYPEADLIETETGAALGAHADPLSFGLAISFENKS